MLIVHIWYNLTKFYCIILTQVSVRATRTDWPVQPSAITKKRKEKDMEEKMGWVEEENGGL